MEELPATSNLKHGQKSHSEDVLSKPSKSALIEDDIQSKLHKNIFKNLKSNVGSIVMLVLLCIMTPSWDVYSDWAVTIQLFLRGDPLYAISMMVPQILNVVFTFFMWKKLEKEKAKRWSWILVIIQCWPQFFAARIVWMILNGERKKEMGHI